MHAQGTDPGRAFGEYLRAERELRQISLAEVADVTKIPLRTLEQLERGKWADLPAQVFVRGFVRSYARHIGLAEEDACRNYSEALAQGHPQEAVPTPAAEDLEVEGESSRRRFELAIFVIIVLILATITLSLLWRGSGQTRDIQAEADTQQQTTHRA